MNSFLTVVRFTFINRAKSKPFIISSILTLLLICIAINLPALIDKFSSGKPASVGMIEDKTGVAAALQAYFKTQDKPGVAIMLFPSAGSAAADDKQMVEKLKEKAIKGYLTLTPDPTGGFPGAIYKAETMISSSKKTSLEEGLRLVKMDMNSRSAGLTQEQLGKLFGPVKVEVLQISPTGEQAGRSEGQRNTAYALVYVLLFLLFFIVTMYGNLIATEITAEKSSRVMEIIITSVSPLKQMFGKITGMFLLGLTQIIILIAAGAINLFAIKNNRAAIESLGLDLHALDVSLIVYFVFFFILGFFLYATLLAGVGSLVSRTEELGQAILPVTLLSLAGFYISIYGLNNPASPFVAAMSFVPFFAPMLMLLRIGMIGVPVWEVALGFLSIIAGIFIFGLMAAKIYRVGVLMYGKRPSMKEVFRANRAFKV